MKIEKFVKLKNCQYKLCLENGDVVCLHEDLILKKGLLISKDIDVESYDSLINENNIYVIRDVALKFIGKKIRSKREVYDYLKKNDYSICLINDIIDDLENKGYINNFLYAKAYVNDRIFLSMDGPFKIKNHLFENDIDDDIINNAMREYTLSLEEERVNKIVNKMIKANRNKSEYFLKKKIRDYLVNEGYSYGVIELCVDNITIDDSMVYKNEYNKLYKKLKGKYSEDKIDYIIRCKLYQKGFIK